MKNSKILRVLAIILVVAIDITVLVTMIAIYSKL